MEINTLSQVSTSLEKLRKIITDSPEVLECLKLLQSCKSEIVVTPVKADKLIGQKEASEILGVSANRIGDYVRTGLLTAYYTPPASNRKFWLSDVLKLPKSADNQRSSVRPAK